ncbi:SAS-6 [Mytilus edulis]|uniref:SAS-6 n=1 Tax=Mytilus edulis TaxID=6550 RepID=A0A8S3SYB8_MYTED|nr:SAS-6 [Mytilus edulis]
MRVGDLTQTHTIYNSGVEYQEIIPTEPQSLNHGSEDLLNSYYNSGVVPKIIPTDNHKPPVEDLTQTHTIITQGRSTRNYPNRQPQVQYNPGNPRRTTIPQPSGGRGGPPPPIPEEIRPHHHSPASNHSGGDKENDPPLDPKYLQKSDDAIHIRGLGPRTHSPPTISSSAPNLNSVRLSQQGIVPRTTQPPLASAYFPGQKMS